jgi:membrane-associated protease RseP (regulator of RpoE activity)
MGRAALFASSVAGGAALKCFVEGMFRMKNILRLFFQLFALVLLLFQTPLCGSAQETKTPAVSTDLQFASGQSARRIPFEFVGNHIYLQGRVNSSEPLWLLLDTGATASYFDVQQAKALGLGVQGESIKVAVSLAGVKLHNQTFSVQPLTFGVYDGHAVDALLGYDFIDRFVVEIDYVSRTIDLYDPQSYQYFGSGEVIPLVMLEDDSGGKVPLVRTRITQRGREPIEGKFIADIAVRSAMSFNSPFVETNKLLQATQKTIQAVLGGGAMVRESKQPIGRVANIQLGRFTFKDSVAVFFQDKKGVLASPEFDGIIGGEILRRFRVMFDYSRERMILEPNRYFSEPFEYDMSGVLLTAEGTDFKIFKVRQLIENSPATVAGLREGDVISAVNGKAASKLTLEQVRQMFKKEGRSYLLSIKRGDEKIQTRIRLRRLI